MRVVHPRKMVHTARASRTARVPDVRRAARCAERGRKRGKTRTTVRRGCDAQMRSRVVPRLPSRTRLPAIMPA